MPSAADALNQVLAGNKTAGTKTAAPAPRRPKTEVVRLSARLLHAKGGSKPTISRQVAEALQGIGPHEVGRVGRKIGLSPKDIDRLQQITVLLPYNNPKTREAALAAESATNPVSAAKVTEIAGRPAQAVLGAIAQGGEGALQGLTGEKTFSPISAGYQALGYKPQAAARAEQNISPWVREPVNFAVQTLVDPTTYVGAGIPFRARMAAVDAAKALAGQAAEDVVLNQASRDALKRIMAEGPRAVPKGTLAPRVAKELRGVRGGVRVFGRTVPGTQHLLPSNLGPTGSGFMSGAEEFFRPRGKLRGLERAGARNLDKPGALAEGTRQQVENIQARIEGADTLAKIAGAEVAGTVRKTLREAGLSRRAARQATRTFDKLSPEAKDLVSGVRDAMDVGGGQAAVGNLEGVQAKLAEALGKFRDADYKKLQEIGRLLPEKDVNAARAAHATSAGEAFVPVTPQDQYLYHMPSQVKAAEDTKSFVVRDSAGNIVPGRTPGFLRTRTERVPVAQRESIQGHVPELNPVVMVGAHAAGTEREAERVAAFGQLAKMADNKGNPLFVARQDVADTIKSQSGWEKNYEEIKGPIQEVAADGTIHTRDTTYLIHKAIAPVFKKLVEVTKDAHWLNETLRPFNSLWAQSALSTTGFISRNVLQGNLLLAAMAGARNPYDLIRAFHGMGQITQLMRGTRTWESLSEADRTLLQNAIRDNAVESGLWNMIGDLSAHGSGRFARGVTRIGKVNPILLANRWFEDASRLAVYIAKTKQGYSGPSAAAFARHYLFDYKDVAAAGELGKLVNPFFTWTYKSAPLIVSEAIHDPRRVIIPLKFIETFGKIANDEGGRRTPERIVSEWIRDSGGQRIPDSVLKQLPLIDSSNPSYLLPDTPIHTTLDLFKPLGDLLTWAQGNPTGGQQAFRDALAAVGPGGVGGGAISTVYETVTGKDVFTGREYPPGTQVDTIFGKLPWEVANGLDNLAPLWTRVQSLIAPDKYSAKARGRRAFSMLFGFSIYPMDSAARKSEFWRRYNQLLAVQNNIKSGGGNVPTSAEIKPKTSTTVDLQSILNRRK